MQGPFSRVELIRVKFSVRRFPPTDPPKMLGYLFLLSLLAGAAHGGCPNQWIKYNNNCYYFNADPTTFPKAAGVCRQLRSSFFVLPVDSNENHFLGNNVKYSGTWIANVRPDETRQVSGGYDNYDSKMTNPFFDGETFSYCKCLE